MYRPFDGAAPRCAWDRAAPVVGGLTGLDGLLGSGLGSAARFGAAGRLGPASRLGAAGLLCTASRLGAAGRLGPAGLPGSVGRPAVGLVVVSAAVLAALGGTGGGCDTFLFVAAVPLVGREAAVCAFSGLPGTVLLAADFGTGGGVVGVVPGVAGTAGGDPEVERCGVVGRGALGLLLVLLLSGTPGLLPAPELGLFLYGGLAMNFVCFWHFGDGNLRREVTREYVGAIFSDLAPQCHV